MEFAPGLGATARLTLACRPEYYTAVERDRDAAAVVQRILSGPNQSCVVGTAEQTGLADASATIVYGEAMLSMQPPTTKARIIAEAARLLRTNGRYGIHELCLTPNDVPNKVREAICRELSDGIQVGVRPLTVQEWEEALMLAGFRVIAQEKSAMRLLEPARLIRDEGLLRVIRFVWNVAWHSQARRRVLAMRRVFRKYEMFHRQ